MFIHSYCVSWIHGHILISKDIVSIFPATVRSTFLQKSVVGWSYSDTKSDWTVTWHFPELLTWRHVQNIVPFRVLYKFVNLISTLVICLKLVFIEMLNKLITYIICWYTSLYQVLPIAWTNHITIATRNDTGSHNRLDLIQSLVPTHYSYNGYVSQYYQHEVNNY